MSMRSEERSFDASWDWVVYIITWLATAAFVCATVVGIGGAIRAGHPVGSCTIATFLGAILFVAWLFAPTRYVLTDSELIVETHGPALRFSRRRFLGAQVITRRRWFGLALRCGDGGLFGIYGLFWSSKVGLFHCWLTRLRPLVLIERKNGWPLAISPDSPEEFVSCLTSDFSPR